MDVEMVVTELENDETSDSYMESCHDYTLTPENDQPLNDTTE